MTITTQTIDEIIDIHSHIIFDVDDGSDSLDSSVKALIQAKKINLKKIICTPHIRYGNKERIEKIKKNFLELKKYADKLEIELYLGTEIMLTDKTSYLLKTKRLRSLDGKKYVLVELKREESMDIDNVIYMLDDLIDMGFIPILAHPELYSNYRNIEYLRRIKEIGVLLQLDATSILKKKVKKDVYKFSKKLLKEKVIDIVASDNHCNNKRNYNDFNKAYKKIKRKYGKKYTNILFYENPISILE